MNTQIEKTYGCEDCVYFEQHDDRWCNLWDVAVNAPDDSHCESLKLRKKDQT